MQSLEKLVDLANTWERLSAEVEQLDSQLSATKATLRQVEENDIPELMQALGLSEFTMANGRRICIEESIHAGIPKTLEDQAFAWLRANGYDSIIKREVVFKFGKGEDDAATQIQLLAAGIEIKPWSDKASVHHSTLRAFVREALENGQEIPQELFGVFRRTVARVE